MPPKRRKTTKSKPKKPAPPPPGSFEELIFDLEYQLSLVKGLETNEDFAFKKQENDVKTRKALNEWAQKTLSLTAPAPAPETHSSRSALEGEGLLTLRKLCAAAESALTKLRDSLDLSDPSLISTALKAAFDAIEPLITAVEKQIVEPRLQFLTKREQWKPRQHTILDNRLPGFDWDSAINRQLNDAASDAPLSPPPPLPGDSDTESTHHGINNFEAEQDGERMNAAVEGLNDSIEGIQPLENEGIEPIDTEQPEIERLEPMDTGMTGRDMEARGEASAAKHATGGTETSNNEPLKPVNTVVAEQDMAAKEEAFKERERNLQEQLDKERQRLRKEFEEREATILQAAQKREEERLQQEEERRRQEEEKRQELEEKVRKHDADMEAMRQQMRAMSAMMELLGQNRGVQGPQ
ncbi:uncharacterized protein EI97DRAFT_477457 [Westerdykella ornata]|uniref:Uncharacterized protein n=1 Tax=Westerdykella ornata TaxID=318751 RepID=A0A6A6JY44_WESOR|nr:uncharacterized protein EI97DRAFT_477457 [Westerdykella ornata]KAF2279949.1 hypothetical protein EI97DRAFT_477457 [Westerdykella ornata]